MSYINFKKKVFSVSFIIFAVFYSPKHSINAGARKCYAEFHIVTPKYQVSNFIFLQSTVNTPFVGTTNPTTTNLIRIILAHTVEPLYQSEYTKANHECDLIANI